MNNDLERENMHALMLQQALLGAISSNVRLIYMKSSPNAIGVYVVLEHDSDSDREECDDLVMEVEVLFDRPIDVTVHVSVSQDPLFLNRIDGRAIFRRKEN